MIDDEDLMARYCIEYDRLVRQRGWEIALRTLTTRG